MCPTQEKGVATGPFLEKGHEIAGRDRKKRYCFGGFKEKERNRGQTATSSIFKRQFEYGRGGGRVRVNQVYRGKAASTGPGTNQRGKKLGRKERNGQGKEGCPIP